MNVLQDIPESTEERDRRPVVATSPLEEPPQPQPRLWRRITFFAAGFIALCVIAYWQIRSIRSLFGNVLPYASVCVSSLIALGTIIFKDWKNYKPHWVRWALIMGVIAALAFGVAYQYAQREEKAEAARKSQQNIDDLKGQAAAAQQAQLENTKAFTKSFSELNSELNDLKTKVTTKELQNKIATLQARLDKTIDPPRAKLSFSFAPVNRVRTDDANWTDEAVTEKNLPLAADGTFHVDFTVLNLTDVDAMEGNMNLQIGTGCKFAKEPERFTRLAGQDDRRRNMDFNRILAKTVLNTMSADIVAPPSVRYVELGMSFRCHTCIRDTEWARITVHLTPAQ
jgi:hypothetical protein